jgi:hypothetical protein
MQDSHSVVQVEQKVVSMHLSRSVLVMCRECSVYCLDRHSAQMQVKKTEHQDHA